MSNPTPTPSAPDLDLEAAARWFGPGPDKSLTNTFGRALIAEVRALRSNLESAKSLCEQLALARQTTEAALRARPSLDAGACEWKEDDPGFHYSGWKTSCGRMWEFIADGPAENKMGYCMGCGKPVKAVPSTPDPDEDDSDATPPKEISNAG